VLSQSLLNEYRGENVEGTIDDLNIPFYAKKEKKERGACIWTELNEFAKNMINNKAKAPKVLTQ
jgi:hypothetical protein